jgi:leucyl-tRNA synthetase
MIFLKRVKEDGFITKEELRQFLILLNPIAPHITSEMYEIVFGGDIIDDSWPKYDEKYLVEDEIEVPIQINGKLRGVVKAGKEATKEEIFEIAKNSPEIAKYLTAEPKKIIYIAGKIFNIVV